MTHFGQQTALQVGDAPLERCRGELLTYDSVKPLILSATISPTLSIPRFLSLSNISPPAGRTLHRHVEDAEHITSSFLSHCHNNVKGLAWYGAFTVNLDVDAVHKQYRIIGLQTLLELFTDLGTDTFNHTADAVFWIVLTVKLGKHVTCLFLRKAFCIKHSCQAVVFLLLIVQYGKYTGIEVAVAITGNTEFQFTAMAVNWSRGSSRFPCFQDWRLKTRCVRQSAYSLSWTQKDPENHFLWLHACTFAPKFMTFSNLFCLYFKFYHLKLREFGIKNYWKSCGNEIFLVPL